MKIYNLKDQPDCVETLAGWHHSAWGHLHPEISLQERIAQMQEYFSDQFVPSMFVGKSGDAIVGSAAIVAHDMSIHMQLSPWLANVYVNTAYRNKGAASALVRHAMHSAIDAGIQRLYLFTADQERFYERLGWKIFSREHYHGDTVTVMSIEFNIQ